jgi:polar amino acid transport system substrate-binding protein
MHRLAALAVALLLIAFGCAAPPSGPAVTPDVRAQLAPGGPLRVALLGQNPLFVNPGSGPVSGVAVDLGRELASRIGVPFEPVRYEGVGAMVEGASKNEWDIAFLGIDPERAAVMNFTAAYIYGENTFLLAPGLAARIPADLDRPGRTVVAISRSVQEVWLRQNFRNATLISSATGASALQLLKDGKVDAVASQALTLANGAKAIPGSRLMEGSFLDSSIGLAVPRGRPAGHAYAYQFIEDMKASGAVREALGRANVTGARVAEPRAK